MFSNIVRDYPKFIALVRTVFDFSEYFSRLYRFFRILAWVSERCHDNSDVIMTIGKRGFEDRSVLVPTARGIGIRRAG